MTDLPLAVRLPSRWLAIVVLGLDGWLRRLEAVKEYTSDPRCIFRIQIDRLDHTLTLSDGTPLRAGERIINLHLWNEQMPRFGVNAASVAWASRLMRCVEISLRQLCQFLAVTAELSDVVAICADMTFGTKRETAQLIVIAGRFGFQAVQTRPRSSIAQRAFRVGENILIALLILVHHAEAFRRDSLWRDRTRVVLPRSTLEQRYARPLDARPVAH